MKRDIKSWAVFLASFLLMATILPLVTFKDVRADESDYSVNWKSGGAEAFRSYYDEIFEQDFRLFLNADKLVFEFKTDGESMNLKYKVFYGYDYSMPIVESDVVKNTTTLRCAFEPESGKYLVNDKIARGIYNFVVFDVDSEGNESYLYETAAHVTNTTNGIDFEFKCYAILKNDSGEIYRSPELDRSMANVNGFLTKFKIGNAATIIPYSYEVTYDGKVLYTSPEYIYDPSDTVFGATAEYSERVYPIITKELNDFLKEGTYKITYYMFDLEEESFSIEIHIVNSNFPPKTTATFKDPDGYDSKTNVPYYNEPSKIYFDYSVDSNLEPYITLYKDGKPTGINRILRVGSGTNEIRNLDFDVFNEDGTLNYGNYELVFQNIFYEDVVKFPFSVYDKDGKIPTPTPSPTPTTEPTAMPTATPTPTKAPVTTVTPEPTKVPVVTVVPTKAPVTTVSPVPTKAPVTTTNPTVVPSKTPTAAPTTPSTPSTSADNGVGGFIERLYTVAMGRDFDEAGKDYWVNEIKVNGQTGAEVALQFLFSDEFLGKDMSNDQFLDVLYKTFFDRDPEEAGKAYWDGQMKDGMSKTDVIMGFINSPEWANICLKYGIKSGTDIQPTITIEPNEDVKAFAERLYTTCLGRDSEEAGLNYWADELANLRQSGSEVAKGFFFSPEFINSKLDDSEYLTRLYKTVMGREPEAAGFEYWLGEMKAGRMSREGVFDGFAASPEWIGICADYGILR